jgi:iron complex outermembrane recepter protein
MLQPFLLSLLLAGTSPNADTLVVPLPGIVVTGSRANESLLRTPAAVTVVDRRSYANGRGVGLDELLNGIPGVLVQSRAGAQDVRLTIRGYGARGNGERSNSGNMRGIRVLTDGIPVSEPDGRTNLDLIDVGAADRVEVSRSNVSALYGNASGGVVNLRTDLSFAEPFLRVEERAGSFGLHREQLTTGFTAGRGRGTVAVSNTTYEGWRAHSNSSATQVHARFAVPLGEATTDRLLLLADFGSTMIRFPGALTQAQLDADPSQANATFVTRDERRFHRAGRIAATLEHAVTDDQSLTVSGWVEPKLQQRSERGRYRDFTRYHVGGQAVWNLTRSFGDRLEGRTTAGVDEAWLDGSILFWDLTPGGDRATTPRANKREGANSAGGFVQQSLTLDDRWRFQAALRYDNLWYVSQDFITPALDASKHFTRVTPKISLSLLQDEHTVFAAIGGGVEAPAFNEIDPPPPYDTQTALNPFLEAMHSTTYELGARGTIRNELGQWRYDAGLYRIRTANEIVPFNGGAYFFTAGRSERIGVEAALDWVASSRLSLKATANLSRNRYLDYVNNLGDFGGRSMPGLPNTVLSGTARVRLTDAIALSVTGEHMSRLFADDANTAVAPSHALLHASLDARVGGLRAYVSARNLLDRRHVASVYINGINNAYFEPGLPRSFAAGLSLQR